MITRRMMLADAAGLSVTTLAACSQEQLDAALVKLKETAAAAARKAHEKFDSVTLAAPLLKAVDEANDRIQRATTWGEVVNAAAGALAGALDGLANLVGYLPVPGTISAVFRTAAKALRAVAGIAGATPGEPAPTLDQALAQLKAL